MSNQKKLYLAFVWHMHQPYYKDDKNNVTFMPWVFLHAIKDYYDIPWYSEKFETIKATYNLVPSLLFQIESYINSSANDKLLEIIKKEIEALNQEEIHFLQSYLFLANEKNMIKPLPRYYELYLKYKTNNSIQEFNHQEILDTQVLFLLAWCGNYLRQNNPTVQHLLQKGHYFTHQDKIDLLTQLLGFLTQVIQYYKELAKKEKISLSTTPYYHPITPLLLDIHSATQARHDVELPEVQNNFTELGRQNTLDAIEYYHNLFGTKPTGFWPAEGSVDPSTLKLFAKNNIQWSCTDEELLFKTLHNRDKKNLYKNYQLQFEDKKIDIRFRDHYLSDLIGFEYSKKEPKNAAKDFVQHLENIYFSCEFSPLVNVILDGENAWEFFPHNGENFFNELYTLLEKSSWIQTVTMDEISSIEAIETLPLSTIATGSWINGNFDIWIGSKEKNHAWHLLDLTMRDFNAFKSKLDPITLQNIRKEFMIALGSDWFWWYGDDHFTVQAKEFDELFRKHLINIYSYLGLEIPKQILVPIILDTKNKKFHTKPINFISPTIDGRKSNYFEWLGSGVIDLSKEFSVMNGSHNIIQKILYGYDSSNLYLFFEGQLKFDHLLVLYLSDKKKEIAPLEPKVENVELKIPFEELELHNEKISFSFTLERNGKIIQSFPIYDEFTIFLENCELTNWYV